MNLLTAIVLGVLQGLTEFLPVSSSGHLALAEYFFGIDSADMTFEVFVHFGTALAVLVYFRRRVTAIVLAVVRWVFRMKHEPDDAKMGLLLILGTVPAALVGALFEKRVESAFGSPVLVSVLLLVTGTMLWLTRRLPAGTRSVGGPRDALLVGLAQAAAVLPGISRSGATISAGLGLGIERSKAAEFAFLLSIPVILGATAVKLGDATASGLGVGGPVVAGTVAAFASAIPAIALLMRVVSAGTFHRFAYYCWGAGLVALVFTIALGQ